MKKVLSSIGRAIGSGLKALGQLWAWLIRSLANGRRRLFRRRLPDFVVFELSGSLLERNPNQPWYFSYLPNRSSPTSIESLATAFRAIAKDPDVKGVLLLIRGLDLSLAQAQSMHDLFERFRRWDKAENGQREGYQPKQIVAHLEMGGNAVQAMAAGADRVIFTPESEWGVTGLLSEQLYLADSLAKVGIAFDVVKIAPWKTAFDQFQKSEPTEAAENQANWLLDGLYAELIQTIADGRNRPIDEVQTAIDQAPLNAQTALESGLIDAILYEDQLPAYLAQNFSVQERAESSAHEGDEHEGDEQGRETGEAKLAPYSRIRPLLLRKPQKTSKGRIGVISMTGTIIPGKSRSFPIPLPVLGSQTLGGTTGQQQVRAALRDESLSAVVLHVDSPGGSALASDLIWRELTLLAAQKPLVVYMGDVAASGGYYISAPAAKVVAQPATITGSIGVISGKPITKDAYERAEAHRFQYQRGENANLFSDSAPWTDAQREKLFAQTVDLYNGFKRRVADGRGLVYEDLDEICNGRVWTGEQAREHGLVDVTGDLIHAIETACELADLPTDGSVPVSAIEPDKPIMPISAQALGKENEEWMGLLNATLSMAQGEWRQILGQEVHWFWADGLPKQNSLPK